MSQLKSNFLVDSLVLSENNFIYDFIAILNHFVALKTVCYWEENFC